MVVKIRSRSWSHGYPSDVGSPLCLDYWGEPERAPLLPLADQPFVERAMKEVNETPLPKHFTIDQACLISL